MATNPLFPTSDTAPQAPPAQPVAATAPITTPALQSGAAASRAARDADPAVNLIRQKIAQLYGDEPAAEQELAEAEQAGPRRSRHQQFMHELSNSGKSLAEIQTEWHHYYTNLPDDEKRAVWREFYAHSATGPMAPANHHAGGPGQPGGPDRQPSAPAADEADGLTAARQAVTAHGQPLAPAPRVPAGIYPTPTASQSPFSTPRPLQADAGQPGLAAPATVSQPAQVMEYEDLRGPDTIRQQLRSTVSHRAKLKPRHHVQSLLFGLGCGGLALLVVLFSFFNEMVIAPFIQPSRTVSATPIIIGTDGIAPTDKAEVVIPKINVQIPLDFSVKSIKEADVQRGLENGVVHYPTTAMPGQQGNAAFFGHSSNNIFNPGKYKFAFVLLHELVPGDTFYLTNNGVAYAYQVFDVKVVAPTEIGILDPIPGKTATATLITCDPPGTTLRRLAVIGEQVSPSPDANTPAAPPTLPGTPDSGGQTLPGDAPSLWRRMTGWISG